MLPTGRVSRSGVSEWGFFGGDGAFWFCQAELSGVTNKLCANNQSIHGALCSGALDLFTATLRKTFPLVLPTDPTMGGL